MTPRKLNVGFAFYPYGGNGGISNEYPAIRNWLIPLICRLKSDPRVGEIHHEEWADTPICMTRNRSVGWARETGIDVLVMVDSDMYPDLYVGKDPAARPFFDTSFDFLYAHYERGPVVVGAPYCGPPPHPLHGGSENIYVFRWENFESHNDEHYKNAQYGREEAAYQAGIQQCLALPTGLIMWDMRCFDLLTQPYFYYEYKGDGPNCPHCHQPVAGPQEEKCSTEDVVVTRNVALNGHVKLGYNPVYCNWDAWAGHVKQKIVGKPIPITSDRIAKSLTEAVLAKRREGFKEMVVQHDARLPKVPLPESLKKRLEPQAATLEEALEKDPHGFEFSHNMGEVDRKFLSSIVASDATVFSMQDRPMRIVELGSWAGHSAELMAEALEGLADYEIHCIDHWKGANASQRKGATENDVFAIFQKRVARFGEKVIPHRNSTAEGAKAWAWREPDKREIDVLFIDADHSFEGCLADIRDWLPYVKEGGLVCGHDYSSLFPGVKRAVHEVFGWGIDVAVEGTIWVTRKKRTGDGQRSGCAGRDIEDSGTDGGAGKDDVGGGHHLGNGEAAAGLVHCPEGG